VSVFFQTACAYTILFIDYRNAGIGSNSCGPELLPKYKLNEKRIEGFTFYINAK
jgi:hypothetical protein